jgi:hypothetical protein
LTWSRARLLLRLGQDLGEYGVGIELDRVGAVEWVGAADEVHQLVVGHGDLLGDRWVFGRRSAA